MSDEETGTSNSFRKIYDQGYDSESRKILQNAIFSSKIDDRATNLPRSLFYV